MASPRKVVAHIMGGLGNQMFQYAAARALAARSGADLVLDPWTGFVRDRVFKRQYALDRLPVHGRLGTRAEGLPFWAERLSAKYFGPPRRTLSHRWWGDYLWEDQQQFYPEMAALSTGRSTWLHGHWQCERYFENVVDDLARELQPRPSSADACVALHRSIESNQAVAVGVRLFEEMPGAAKTAVGGITSAAFYEHAANRLAAAIDRPVFYVFCTRVSELVRSLSFPGPVHYVTADRGYADPIDSLWLLSACRNHIVSNSSFFWWGAWLAERRHAASRIMIANRFPNPATVPARWTALDA